LNVAPVLLYLVFLIFGTPILVLGVVLWSSGRCSSCIVLLAGSL
jgi:hypothetical protein